MDTEGNDRSFGGLAAAAEAADPANPAAKDALFTALYGELHRLAESHLRKSAGNLTLGTTTLLHEAYLDISQRERLAFPDRSRFFAYASRAMRGLVIDYIRQRKAQKRGGDLTFTTLEDGHGGVGPDDQQVLALGDALEHLGVADPPLAELVDLKFFCGFTFAEVAAMRGVTERTIQRDWAKARVLLHELVTET